MPRAFLITHRRYNGNDFEETARDFSPERGVRVAEYCHNQPTSDGVSDCASEASSECPEELYNLTKLAEVSLAAAAGTLIHPNNVLYPGRLSPHWSPKIQTLDRLKYPTTNESLSNHEQMKELTLRERTRLFFERVEAERDILENKKCLLTPQIIEENLKSSLSSSSSSSSSPVNNPNRKMLSESNKVDENEDHECPDCGKKYSTSSNLARHRQTHRSLGDKKARRCPHCDKVYVSMPAFSMHVRTHNQGCKCHYCGKCFSRPWLLQGHIRTHTGEKPFKCTICNKAFADKSNLRAHIQTHSNTKPHICGRCGKAFALKSYLYKHEESSCMRAHNHRLPDKKDSDNLLINNTVPVIANKIVSSPTSVIVPRPGFIRDTSPTPVTLSTIIRHTRSTSNSSPVPIHPDHGKESAKDEEECNKQLSSSNRDNFCIESPQKTNEYLSRIIRTSVISPNPRHNSAQNHSPFDLSNPSRPSAFSRSSGITLNLAIA